MAEVTVRTTEQAVLLGPRKSLVGIVTQPAVRDRPDLPAILILNTGIVHRIGHNRIYTKLARTLAEAGHTVLRFDFSGIGDSESREEALAPMEASLAEMRIAVDWLDKSKQIDRVILVGLCLGADHSVIYGSSDPRVAGVVLMDPSIPRTARFYINYAIERLRRPDSWTAFATGRGSLWRKIRKMIGAPDAGAAPAGPTVNDQDARSYLERAYQQLTASGIECLAVFTSGMEYGHNYREQLLDAFPAVKLNKRLRLEYFDGCDHTFMFEEDRVRLFGVISDWLATTSFKKPA